MITPNEPNQGSDVLSIQIDPESDRLLKSVSGKVSKDAFINECIQMEVNKNKTHTEGK